MKLLNDNFRLKNNVLTAAFLFINTKYVIKGYQIIFG